MSQNLWDQYLKKSPWMIAVSSHAWESDSITELLKLECDADHQGIYQIADSQSVGLGKGLRFCISDMLSSFIGATAMSSWVVITGYMTQKPKMFTIWLFTGKGCVPLVYNIPMLAWTPQPRSVGHAHFKMMGSPRASQESGWVLKSQQWLALLNSYWSLQIWFIMLVVNTV